MNKLTVLTVAAAVGLLANTGIVSAAGTVSDGKSLNESSLLVASNEGKTADVNAKLVAQCNKMMDEGKKTTKECRQLQEKQKSAKQMDKSKTKYE